jgi:hypothetical protein
MWLIHKLTHSHAPVAEGEAHTADPFLQGGTEATEAALLRGDRRRIGFRPCGQCFSILNFRSQPSTYGGVKNVFTDEAVCEFLRLSSKSPRSSRTQGASHSELPHRRELIRGVLLIFGQMLGKFRTISAIRRSQNHRSFVLLVLHPRSERATKSHFWFTSFREFGIARKRC